MQRKTSTSTPKTHIYAYLRVSAKSQVDGDGFPRQKAAVEAYATSRGLQILRIFREEGVSGSLEPPFRPAFLKMRGELIRRRGSIVLIERLDRLARDLMIQESIIRDFQNQGITLVSVTEPDLLADDPTRKLMRQILGAFAEFEKTMLVAKLRAARERVATRLGRCAGAKPYGHYRGEKQIVAQITTLRTQGLGFDRIAARLNDEGVRPRQGKQWWGLTVNQIVTRSSRLVAAQSPKLSPGTRK